MKIPTIPDEVYDKLVVSISSIGGTWSEKYKGFIFAESENVERKIQKLIDTQEYFLTKHAKKSPTS